MIREEHVTTDEQLERTAGAFAQVLARLRAEQADFILIPPPGVGESRSLG